MMPLLTCWSFQSLELRNRYEECWWVSALDNVKFMSNCCEISLVWMPQNTVDDYSPLVQIMAWCLTAPSHYQTQCLPRSLSLYGVTRPQWVNNFFFHLFREAYAIGKKEKPPFVKTSIAEPLEEENPVPKELLCPLCKQIFTDASVISCCGTSFCDECKYPSISISD